MIRFCFLLLSFSLAFPSAYAQSPKTLPKNPKFMKVEEDITYHKVGSKEVKLDIAVPTEGKGPFPAVICIHGGAWRAGNKKDVRMWFEPLTKNGFVAISISYRLAPDNIWPAQIIDCKTAVRWLKTNAVKYQVDPKKIGVLGYSAGGHLSLLLGLTDKVEGWNGTEYLDQNNQVQCVVDYFGPTDLMYYGKDETALNGVFEPWLGSRYKDKPEIYKKGSPLTYVHAKAPPMLIFHGDVDRLVPVDQSRQLKKELDKLKVPAQYEELKKADHGWGGELEKQTTRQSIEFLKKYLN